MSPHLKLGAEASTNSNRSFIGGAVPSNDGIDSGGGEHWQGCSGVIQLLWFIHRRCGVTISRECFSLRHAFTDGSYSKRCGMSTGLNNVCRWCRLRLSRLTIGMVPMVCRYGRQFEYILLAFLQAQFLQRLLALHWQHTGGISQKLPVLLNKHTVMQYLWLILVAVVSRYNSQVPLHVH